MFKGKKLLIVSAHTDDFENGCGATVHRLIKEFNFEPYLLTFSFCEESIPKEFPKDSTRKESLKSAKFYDIPKKNMFWQDIKVRHFPEHRQEILEVLTSIRKLIGDIDLVICPSSTDYHQDHKTVHEEVVRCFKNDSSIICYEMPRNQTKESLDLYIEVSEKDLAVKIQSLFIYESQRTRDLNKFEPETYYTSLAQIRGKNIRKPFAEAFEVIRLTIKL